MHVHVCTALYMKRVANNADNQYPILSLYYCENRNIIYLLHTD